MAVPNIPSELLANAYAEYVKGTLDPKDLTLKENLDLQTEYYMYQQEITNRDVLAFVKKIIIAQENYKFNDN